MKGLCLKGHHKAVISVTVDTWIRGHNIAEYGKAGLLQHKQCLGIALTVTGRLVCDVTIKQQLARLGQVWGPDSSVLQMLSQICREPTADQICNNGGGGAVWEHAGLSRTLKLVVVKLHLGHTCDAQGGSRASKEVEDMGCGGVASPGGCFATCRLTPAEPVPDAPCFAVLRESFQSLQCRVSVRHNCIKA